MKGRKKPFVPAHRFQTPYIPMRKSIAPTLRRLKSSRTCPKDVTTVSCDREAARVARVARVARSLTVRSAAVQIADSLMVRRANHRQIATTSNWANTMRTPRTPSGDRARLSSSTTTGPEYHRTWATPLCLPRAPSGASSAIRVQDAGTSAPTARPAIT